MRLAVTGVGVPFAAGDGSKGRMHSPMTAVMRANEFVPTKPMGSQRPHECWLGVAASLGADHPGLCRANRSRGLRSHGHHSAPCPRRPCPAPTGLAQVWPMRLRVEASRPARIARPIARGLRSYWPPTHHPDHGRTVMDHGQRDGWRHLHQTGPQRTGLSTGPVLAYLEAIPT